MRILVVEDEPLLADAVAEVLVDEAYAVDLARDGHAASRLMHDNDYDLAVLDWTLPGPSGLELLAQWRERGVQCPVLMLTSRAEVSERVRGLDAGADDYLAKPFAFDELLARVRTLLRRRGQPLQMRLECDDVVMDRARHQVTVAGAPVELSPKEFAVLDYFLRRPDEVVTRTELAEHVWDDRFDATSNVIDVTVHRLRRKIDGDRPRKLVHAVKGVGYVLKRTRE
jgi:DNA-binding response OmpR family regulator